MGSYKKKLFIVLLLILLIGFFVCGSVNASMQDVQYSIDTQALLEHEQEYLATIALSQFSKGNSDSAKSEFETWAKNTSYFPYFNYYINGNSYFIECFFVPINVNWNSLSTVDTTFLLYGDANIQIPCSFYQYTASSYKRFVFYLGFQGNVTSGNYNGNFTIPTQLIFYSNNVVSNFNNGFDPTLSPWFILNNSIKDNTEETEEVKNELKKLNDFMKSEDVDDDAYDMPGNSDNPTQDITQGGIDNIFNIFYDAIDNWNSRDILVTIPFANKIFWIDADLTENIVDNFFPSGIFKNLLGLVWYYLLAVYIIKDVQKYIDGLQTGEILTKSDTNIKTEML